MTAQEARKKVQAALLNEENSQFSEIMKHIENAVGLKKYEVWIYNETIHAVVRNKLKDLGYKVGETQSDRDGSMTKISW